MESAVIGAVDGGVRWVNVLRAASGGATRASPARCESRPRRERMELVPVLYEDVVSDDVLGVPVSHTESIWTIATLLRSAPPLDGTLDRLVKLDEVPDDTVPLASVVSESYEYSESEEVTEVVEAFLL